MAEQDKQAVLLHHADCQKHYRPGRDGIREGNRQWQHQCQTGNNDTPVVSGAGDPQRTRQAMQAVTERLVLPAAKLIKLLDPPFDCSALHPGYIKGYVPGVRENGGQYTHAAVWNAMAFAFLGENERAWELTALLNPIHHGATRDRNCHLQSGAICHRRRCLCSRAPHGPGRLDLVYRFSRLDVSAAH
jgi:cellobiose phosphorylase